MSNEREITRARLEGLGHRTVPAERFTRLLDGAMSGWAEVQALRDAMRARLTLAEQRPDEPGPTISARDVEILTRATNGMWEAIQASGVRPAAGSALADLEEIADEIDHLGLAAGRRIRQAVEKLRGVEAALSKVAAP